MKLSLFILKYSFLSWIPMIVTIVSIIFNLVLPRYYPEILNFPTSLFPVISISLWTWWIFYSMNNGNIDSSLIAMKVSKRKLFFSKVLSILIIIVLISVIFSSLEKTHPKIPHEPNLASAYDVRSSAQIWLWNFERSLITLIPVMSVIVLMICVKNFLFTFLGVALLVLCIPIQTVKWTGDVSSMEYFPKQKNTVWLKDKKVVYGNPDLFTSSNDKEINPLYDLNPFLFNQIELFPLIMTSHGGFSVTRNDGKKTEYSPDEGIIMPVKGVLPECSYNTIPQNMIALNPDEKSIKKIKQSGMCVGSKIDKKDYRYISVLMWFFLSLFMIIISYILYRRKV